MQVDSIPQVGLTAIPNENDRVVLAHGEVTGHHHSFKASDRISFFRANEGDGGRYLSIGGNTPAELTHQEHSTIAIPPGNYKVLQQREYTPEANKIVAD